MSLPSKYIFPAEGGKTPVMRLKKVVLPEPFGPMIAFIEPLSTSRLIPLTAISPPKFLVNPLVLRMNSFVEDKSTSSNSDLIYLKLVIRSVVDFR
jgi:hypothetical protein